MMSKVTSGWLRLKFEDMSHMLNVYQPQLRETAKMSCHTKLQETAELDCIFPDSVGEIKGLSVHFQPDYGGQRLVVGCTSVNSLDCYYEDGFSGNVQDFSHAKIKLPDSFIQESGSFTCQIPGLPISDITSCPWPPKVLTANPGHVEKPEWSLVTTTFGNGSSFSTESKQGDGDNSAVLIGVIGAVMGTFLVICIVTIIFLWKRWTAFKREDLQKRDKGDPKVQDVENTVSAEENQFPLNNKIEHEKETVTTNSTGATNTESNAHEYSSNEPLIMQNKSSKAAEQPEREKDKIKIAVKMKKKATFNVDPGWAHTKKKVSAGNWKNSQDFIGRKSQGNKSGKIQALSIELI